jgi:hypothetical protein
VLEGVFDEGLEQEDWDEAIEGVLRDLLDDAEAVAEADLLDGEVAADELEFVAEGEFLGFGVFEGQAEEVAEIADHFVGRVWVPVDERGDGIEGVEEEVGLELGPECGKAALGEAGCEFEATAFAFAGPSRVQDGSGGADDDPVDWDVEARAHQERAATAGAGSVGPVARAAGRASPAARSLGAFIGRRRAGFRVEGTSPGRSGRRAIASAEGLGEKTRCGDDGSAAEEVNAKAEGPASPFEGEADGEGDDDRGEGGPWRPFADRGLEGGLPFDLGGEDQLGREGEGDHSPQQQTAGAPQQQIAERGGDWHGHRIR